LALKIECQRGVRLMRASRLIRFSPELGAGMVITHPSLLEVTSEQNGVGAFLSEIELKQASTIKLSL
jgi:hypothetical protein